MANYYGGLGWIGFKKETTPGTAAATTSQFFQTDSFLLNQDHKPIDLKVNFGTLGDAPSLPGTITPSGKMSTLLPASLPHPFYWALGNVTKTGTGPYTHTITPANVLPSLTVEGNEVAINMKQSGVYINKLSLACASGDVAKLTMEWFGLNHTDNATLTSTPTYVTDFLTLLNATITIGGTAMADVDNIQLDIDNQLEAQFPIGTSRYPAQIVRKNKPKITGKITFIDYPSTLYQAFVNASTVAININLTASGGKSLTINIPAAAFSKGFAQEIKDGPVTADADFTVFQDPVSSNIITVTAVNQVADLTV